MRNVHVKYHCFVSPARIGLRTGGSMRAANSAALRRRPWYSNLRLNGSEPT